MTTRGKHSRKLTSISELSLRALEAVVPRGEYATGAEVYEWILAHMQDELAGRKLRSDSVRTSLKQHEPKKYVEPLTVEGELKRWKRTDIPMVDQYSAAALQMPREPSRREPPPKHWMDDSLLAWMYPCRRPDPARIAKAELVPGIPIGHRLAQVERFKHRGR